MKKLIIVFFIFMVSSTHCYANRINVCDFGVDRFIQIYNSIVKKQYNNHEDISIDNLHTVVTSLHNEQNEALYSCPTLNANNGNGTVINLIVNQAGYIEVIHITNNEYRTREETGLAYLVTLITLGLDKKDIDYFCKNPFSPQKRWVITNRILISTFRSANKNVGFDTFSLVAFDKD